MEIKCFVHPNCNAVYVCEECGFLCGEHAKEEDSKSHILVLINNQILNLYKAIAEEHKLSSQITIISQIKERVEAILQSKQNSSLVARRLVQTKIESSKSSKLGVGADVLNRLINISAKLSHKNDQENGPLHKLSEMLNNLLSFKEIESQSTTKYSEKYWSTLYSDIMNKYGENDYKMGIVKRILQNKTGAIGINSIRKFRQKQPIR